MWGVYGVWGEVREEVWGCEGGVWKCGGAWGPNTLSPTLSQITPTLSTPFPTSPEHPNKLPYIYPHIFPYTPTHFPTPPSTLPHIFLYAPTHTFLYTLTPFAPQHTSLHLSRIPTSSTPSQSVANRESNRLIFPFQVRFGFN